MHWAVAKFLTFTGINLVMKSCITSDYKNSVCSDFYEYSCENFRKSNAIPNYLDVIFVTDKLQTEANERIRGRMIGKDELPPEIMKIRNFYFSCMDEDGIRNKGMESLSKELVENEFDLLPNFHELRLGSHNLGYILVRLHARFSKATFLFDVGVKVDNADPQKNIMYIGSIPFSGKASLDERIERIGEPGFIRTIHGQQDKMLVVTPQEHEQFLKTYMENVVDYMYKNEGFDATNHRDCITERIENVAQFIMRLEKAKDIGKFGNYNEPTRLTLRKLQELTNSLLQPAEITINWSLFLLKLFFHRESDAMMIIRENRDVLLTNYDQFKEVMNILKTTQRDVLGSAIWFIIIDSMIPIVGGELLQHQKIYHTNIYKIPEKPRELQCLEEIKSIFGDVIYELEYSSAYYEKNQRKLEIKMMFNNLQEIFVERVENTNWLDTVSKEAISEKIRNMRIHVSWKKRTFQTSYTYQLPLNFQKDSYYENVSSVLAARRKCNLDFLFVRNGYSRKERQMFSMSPFLNPYSISPWYFYDYNDVVIPAELLQFPFFGSDEQAMNYGATAMLIAREMTRALDERGQRDIFEKYSKSPQRSNNAFKKYFSLTNDFRRIYTFGRTYPPVYMCDKTQLDRALPEIIAENTGLDLAWKAYVKFARKEDEKKNKKNPPQYTDDQLFTLAFAGVRMWCERKRDSYTTWQTQNDYKLSNSLRVNGVMKNFDEFQNIWKCKKEDQMTAKFTRAKILKHSPRILDTCTRRECEDLGIMLAENMNVHIPACKDFYEFSCGKFREKLLRYEDSIASFMADEHSETVNDRVPEPVIRLSAGPKEMNNIKNFYLACNDAVAIANSGRENLIKEFAKVHENPMPNFHVSRTNPFELGFRLARMYTKSIKTSFLFDFGVKPDPTNNLVNLLYIGSIPHSGKASFDERMERTGEAEFVESILHEEHDEMIIVNPQEHKKFLMSYMTKAVVYMYQMENITLDENSQKIVENRIKDVAELMMQLEKAKNIGKFGNYEEAKRVTLQELQEITNKFLGNKQIEIDWNSFLETLLGDRNEMDERNKVTENKNADVKNTRIKSISLPNMANNNFQKMIILITNFTQFERLMEILQNTDINVIASAFWWIILESMGPMSDIKLQEFYFEYRRNVFADNHKSWSHTCTKQVISLFGKYLFWEESSEECERKKRFQEIKTMVDNLKKSFTESLTKSDRLDTTSKTKFLEKIRNMSIHISYRKRKADFAVPYLEKLEFQRHLYYENIAITLRMRKQINLNYLFVTNSLALRPSLNPYSARPMYFYDYNYLEIPPKLFVLPFSAHGLQVMNFGALGMLIAREMARTFDFKGERRNSIGLLDEGEGTHSVYKDISECLARTYKNGGLFPFDTPDTEQIIQNTLPETVVENVGLQMAWKAYEIFQSQKNLNEQQLGYLPYETKQLFTIAFANMWCENSKDTYVWWQRNNDYKVSNKIRVTGVMKNFKPFRNIWRCKSKDPMTGPSKQCKIWP